MISLIKNVWDAVKRSLWIIPFLMTLCGLGLGIGFYHLDWFLWENEIPLLGQSWGIDAEGVRILFSNFGGAIITAMTTILSITLLIFTVLAGHFGSHVLRVFKVQTFSKVVIGFFSGTYVYIIFNIYKVTTGSGAGYIPQISITFGIACILLTIFLLLFYVHFLVRQIQAGSVISAIAKELNGSIMKLEDYAKPEKKNGATFLPETLGLLKHAIFLGVSGYIQSIDKDALEEIADKNAFVIKIPYRTGQFIVTGAAAAIVYSSNEIDEKTKASIRSCFIVGEKRIPVKDLECDLELLVEMILRALSPGINDIVVANNCIDYVGESLALLVKKKFPDPQRYSKEGKLLLIAKEFSFEGYLNAVLNPVRQYALEHCSVTIRLLDILNTLLSLTEAAEYRDKLRQHFESLYQAAAAAHQNPLDQESLGKRRSTYLSLAD